MAEAKYVCSVSGIPKGGPLIKLNNSSISKLNIADWTSLTFSIEDKALQKNVANIQLNVEEQQFSKRIVPYISSSGEDAFLAKNFFRTFRQSPFRLVLFSTLSFLEKNGIHSFGSDNGLNDAGVSHLKQIRQRIIVHKKEFGMYDPFLHKFGEFPRLSFDELSKILAANKVVPERLLPPESMLRSIRAKSYAHLELAKLGKKKYKQLRRSRLRG